MAHREFAFSRSFSGALLGVTFLFSCQALAYVPPSQFILKTWLAKHSGVKSVKVVTRVTAMENGRLASAHFKEVSVVNFENGVFRSLAMDDSDRKVYLAEKSLSHLSLPSKILFGKDLQEVGSSLRSAGVPIQLEAELLQLKSEEERIRSEDESIKRWKDRNAWVIGSKAQLWFEKDSFLPLRVFQAGPFEVSFEGYTFSHEFPYPRLMTISDQAGRAVLVSQLVEFTVNSDHPSFRKNFAGGEASGFTEGGGSVSSDVKHLIKQYYESIR